MLQLTAVKNVELFFHLLYVYFFLTSQCNLSMLLLSSHVNVTSYSDEESLF